MATDMSKYSEPFTKMAETVVHNEGRPFAGAAVIVPPNDVTPIDFFNLASTPDEGQFWASLMTMIQIRLDQIKEQRQVGRTFGIR
jgi:hypothetical protein